MRFLLPAFPALRHRMTQGLPLLLLAGCSAPSDREERVAADRQDVTHALYVQLDEVLARRKAIANEEGEALERERADLDRLADEIAKRIVRLDPNADVDVLVRRLEQSR